MFDFGSPNAFPAMRRPGDRKRNSEIRIRPVLLGGIFKATITKSPAETLAGVKTSANFTLETERRQAFGVKPYVWNPFFR
jgi:2-hydroxychromene-2-carboxylate isomerase